MALSSKTATSFEAKVNKLCGILLLILVIMTCVFLAHSQWTLAQSMSLAVPLIVIGFWVCALLRSFAVDTLNTFYNSLEHINKGAFNTTPYQKYQRGVLRSISLEYQLMQEKLQELSFGEQKDAYVMYQLIEQLDTPVLLFDHLGLLIKANKTSSSFLGKDWRLAKGLTFQEVGLELENNGQIYCLNDSENWSVKSCISTSGSNKFYLVVLQDIEQELREKEQSSWQQLIKVVGHEVRNSLTPIYSLSSALAESNKQDHSTYQALQVIANRSKSLQEFVNNTTKLSDIAKPVKDKVEISALLTDCCNVIPDLDYQLNTFDNLVSLPADRVQLEQVFINLLKNAVESSPEPQTIHISITPERDGVTVSIKDNGTGIYETNNLFTPFYTTKPEGSGIGLPLSKKIIESHNGRIWVNNNEGEKGVTASVWLPA